jgi:hypothetical protein
MSWFKVRLKYRTRQLSPVGSVVAIVRSPAVLERLNGFAVPLAARGSHARMRERATCLRFGRASHRIAWQAVGNECSLG